MTASTRTDSQAPKWAGVVDDLVAQMESGVLPWRPTWSDSPLGVMPFNGASGHRYTGINILVLWAAAQSKGYRDPRWMTYKQAQGIGNSVRRGEKATRIVFASQFIPDEEKKRIKSGELKESDANRIWGWRVFSVFNASQLNDSLEVDAPATAANTDIMQEIDRFAKNTMAIMQSGEPSYNVETDIVSMPSADSFANADSYGSTLYHELAHWTGAAHRLNREYGHSMLDEKYAKEELVAELAAAFLCAEYGLQCSSENAAYLDHWIRAIRQQPKYLLHSASAASKAASYLQDLQG